LTIDGLVAAQAQEPLSYQWRAQVDTVKVKVGDNVGQGDSLIDFNSTEAVRNVGAAQARLKDALSNVAKAQRDAQAKQGADAAKYAADEHARQQVILDAQINLSRAQDNLTAIKAGRTATQKEVANTAVTYYGSTTLASAQDALDKILAGADEATIAAARRDVANAQLVVDKARQELDKLTRGPDPGALRIGELKVQKAQAQLQAAQSAGIDPKAPDASVAKQQHDLSIQDAQLALDNAQAEVAQLKQPPASVDFQAAKFHVTDAESNLTTAQSRLNTLLAGPDPAVVDGAQHQVEYAKHALSELQAAADEVNSHPQPWELAQAEDQVRKAQAVLDNAKKPLPALDEAADYSLLEDAVNQAQDDVAAAQNALEATHLRAGFAGTVVSVRVRAGDTVIPDKPLVVLAKPGVPIVHVDLDDATVARLAVGQQATIPVGADLASAVQAAATVASVTPAAKDGSAGAWAVLSVKWPDGEVPRFGSPVSAVVTMQQKDNVLLIPKNAVRKSGSRAMVEVQDGSLRRLVNVQIGITSVDRVEIVSGLTEGQVVLAGPV
jgi:multidrug resistance efflux pump